DRDAEAFLHEPGDIAVGSMEGDAAHRNALTASVLRTGGQCQLEGARRHQRVLIEHFVEIAHAKEHDRIAILTLCVQILAHRGRWGLCGGRHRRDDYYPVLVLALDTTTSSGSCALARDARVLCEQVNQAPNAHAEHLPGDLMSLLGRAGVALSEIDAFAVAIGPGSFTGLRIGIATMQGLAFAAGKALVGVSGFDALARLAGSGGRVATWVDAWR